MNYQESLKYLYSLGFETLVMKFGLENIRQILNELNNPQKNFLKIQIVGTNGKGSVCAFLNAVCSSAKIKTGLFTSPHIVSINERIKINETDISDEDFARHTTIVRKVCDKLVKEKKIAETPTFFEHITAIALSFFAESGIELAILETGLGGRFDSVTACDAEIIGFTPVDYDHQEYLGETLTEIANEKAGVIRFENQQVIVSKQPPEAEKVILQRCREFNIKPRKTDFDFPNYKLSLAGKHQIENAKVAILLAEELKKFFPLNTENIIEGLQTAKHPGRLEFYENILFDGAHNRAGAKSLSDFLDESGKKPRAMIFGIMKEKDLSEIAEILFPKTENLILTKPDNPRSMETSDIVKFVPKNFEGKIFQTATVEEALNKAEEICGGENLILITGSLYLIGEARKILKIKSEI